MTKSGVVVGRGGGGGGCGGGWGGGVVCVIVTSARGGYEPPSLGGVGWGCGAVCVSYVVVVCLGLGGAGVVFGRGVGVLYVCLTDDEVWFLIVHSSYVYYYMYNVYIQYIAHTVNGCLCVCK